jgi:transposase
VIQASDGATRLLGMPGFVAGVQELVDGEWVIYVETDKASTGCPACGVVATAHGRRRVVVRDLPVAGRPVVLLWAKRIWRCGDPDCEKKTWTETSEAISARAVLTERARAEICRRVGAEEDSVAAMAREFGVSWAAAMAAVRDYGKPLVDDPARLANVRALGVDETTFLHARPGRPGLSHPTENQTGDEKGVCLHLAVEEGARLHQSQGQDHLQAGTEQHALRSLAAH